MFGVGFLLFKGKKFNIEFLVEPKVYLKAQDDQPVRPIGQSITLFCNVTGNPPPMISWVLDEQTIIPSPDGIRISLSVFGSFFGLFY